MLVSIIIPTLNEEVCLGATLAVVSNLRGLFEIIVVDGGSTDRTVEIAAPHAHIVHSARGRGTQMAAGAEAATGEVLWFLHADTLPSPGALEAIEDILTHPRISGGNFSLCFDGDGRSARQLTLIYSYLRLIGLCYGDSGIFVRRSAYQAVGGFQAYPLFEDVDLVRRLRRLGKFTTLSEKLTTSSRRFEHRNFGMMFAEWTALQVLYWAGVSPFRLARLYAPIRRKADASS